MHRLDHEHQLARCRLLVRQTNLYVEQGLELIKETERLLDDHPTWSVLRSPILSFGKRPNSN